MPATATDHPNVDLMRQGYAAFATGDMDRLRNELLAPDIVWHNSGRNRTSGDYEGVEQVLGFFLNLFTITNGTFRVELKEIGATDDMIFGIGVANGSIDGRSVSDEPYIHVARVRDGKMAKAWIVNLNQARVDEFYG